ncbi:hypothetical protein ACU4I5_31040 (plasmid) [Ensifer adhaerens]
MFRKGFRLATALAPKEMRILDAQIEAAPQDQDQSTEHSTERSPFPLDRIPEYQSYMPFVVFLPPPLHGKNVERAEVVRHQFLQESLHTAERWHERIEQIHLEGKIDQQKRDDFHEHISNVLDDLRNNSDSDFWLSIQHRPTNKFAHELIRDYLAKNTNNRPRDRHQPRGNEPRFGTIPDFFIPAGDFLSQGCTVEPGLITSYIEIKDDYIIYGPYRPYPVGVYEVKFDLGFAARVAAPGLSLTVDVSQGENILASASRDSLNMAYTGAEHSLQFTNSDPGASTEFRVHVSGLLAGAKITFKGVRLFKK